MLVRCVSHCERLRNASETHAKRMEARRTCITHPLGLVVIVPVRPHAWHESFFQSQHASGDFCLVCNCALAVHQPYHHKQQRSSRKDGCGLHSSGFRSNAEDSLLEMPSHFLMPRARRAREKRSGCFVCMQNNQYQRDDQYSDGVVSLTCRGSINQSNKQMLQLRTYGYMQCAN